MNRAPLAVVSLTLMSLVLAGCNLPRQDAGAIQTSAAMTVEAQITAAAPSPTATSTTAPFPTLPGITATIAPAASPTSTCDVAQFITDVTIPDDTILAPNANFTKTWRLRNIGACSWTPSYAVVFQNGEAMSGPATQALTANVNAGQTVDLSVNLKAPSTAGTYTGNWRLRNGSGVAFTNFYVRIKVQPPGPQSVDLHTVAAEDGHVLSTGGVLGPPNVGDSPENAGREAFLSFDISGIPSNATITKVVTDFRDYDIVGDPFVLGNDGCVRAYVQDYGTLDAADFFNADPTGAVARWCSTAELDAASEQADMKTALQGKLGSSRFQVRIQFRPPLTNNDGVGDVIRLGDVKLVVTYTTP
ncbi:MAG TPA: NBR1-Ig-like domain-containing protein [Anaerolineales bacterium]|nr:NBR1-Ig-like domain-containing protein [Anaerolineales bacterium]